ncbi:MAG TPA: hypothetical protein VEU08_07190, partial [Vicinamibacterales bacterium]|nr:hypothetical protein [Vicinamibacterales bacterium]
RLFFLDGVDLPDPDGLLEGSGNVVRSIVLDDDGALDRPAVQTLMAHAVDRGDVPFPKNSRRRIVIRAAVKKRRPRR